jgi:hypothetical protein
MNMTDNGERKYIHGALVLSVQSAQDLASVRALIDDGRQVLALVSARMERADYDTLTEKLIELADEAGATLTAIQVGSERPKGWRRWLARLNATRTFLLTPKSLDDPSVAVFWAPEADTGIKRLVVGEIKTFRVRSRED